MKIFNDLKLVKDIPPTAVALGNFDGVHKGHQELLRRTVNAAKGDGLKSAVFTFSNHPRNLIGRNPVKNILSNAEKEEVLERIGVDYLFNVPFTEEIMTMSPETFVEELLLDKFNMRAGFCGFNYRFGYKASGTPEVMMHMGIEKGFSLSMIEPYRIEGLVVSSSLIRELIECGEVDQVEKFMGRRYTARGEVVVGNRLGKSLGFPTSNLNIDPSMVTPLSGVYATYCTYNGVRYPSITNVGYKPTIGEFEKNIETHIFNFEKELYGKNIQVEFLKMERAERKFGSKEELSEQIRIDCNNIRAFHKMNIF